MVQKFYLVSYQREVDKTKLTTVAKFENLTFQAQALRRKAVTLLEQRAQVRNVSFSKFATAVNLPLSTSR